MEEKDLLARLNAIYPKLSKGQKQIATYIMNHYDRAAFITASKMGQTVGVSESTVVRFSYMLGYDGYPALQRALQELIRTKLTAIQRIRLTSDTEQTDILKTVLKADIHNLRTTLETISEPAFENSVSAILKANRIYIIAVRSAYPLAQFLAYYLRHVCDGSVFMNDALHDTGEMAGQIKNGDVCIAISFPRYSSRTAQAIKLAKEHGALTIAITDSPSSPLVPYADHLLTARSDMASFADSLVAPLSLINAIIVAVGMHRKDALMVHFDKMERLWGSQHVYITKSEDPMDAPE
ncbi:MurR/RpiR family transcriptional regulator [Christensenellaceae bacterium OttesenSCG-928-M15]|nr:MurR/RpiR family transcriptional regulator [Christensenellaceae bacterium OttesenSCG-928-M15]